MMYWSSILDCQCKTPRLMALKVSQCIRWIPHYVSGRCDIWLLSSRLPVWVWHLMSIETCMWGEATGSGCCLGHIHWQRCCTRGEPQRILHMPPLKSTDKAAHSGFETQGTHHQKSETGVSVAPKMDMYPTKIFNPNYVRYTQKTWVVFDVWIWIKTVAARKYMSSFAWCLFRCS